MKTAQKDTGDHPDEPQKKKPRSTSQAGLGAYGFTKNNLCVAEIADTAPSLALICQSVIILSLYIYKTHD
jgi:hypothetical protein